MLILQEGPRKTIDIGKSEESVLVAESVDNSRYTNSRLAIIIKIIIIKQNLGYIHGS